METLGLKIFSAQELDYLICAVIKSQTELQERTALMQRFGTGEHLAHHQAKLELGGRLIERLTEMEMELGE